MRGIAASDAFRHLYNFTSYSACKQKKPAVTRASNSDTFLPAKCLHGMRTEVAVFGCFRHSELAHGPLSVGDGPTYHHDSLLNLSTKNRANNASVRPSALLLPKKHGSYFQNAIPAIASRRRIYRSIRVELQTFYVGLSVSATGVRLLPGC